MWKNYILLALCLPTVYQQKTPMPLHSVTTTGNSSQCPTAEESAAIREDLHQQVLSFVNSLIPQPPCACGGPGLWTRIAHLNMSDPSQQCPSNWSLVSTPVRGCVGSSNGAVACDSVFFPSNNQTYRRVCGRVNAYQRGSTDAFNPIIEGRFTGSLTIDLDTSYVDGLSLTHGAAGSRQHIWTFAASLYENNSPNFYEAFFNCECTNTAETWPYEVPSFVGNNYFCDTGNTGPGFDASFIYSEDILWDGEGCGPTNTCCQLNNPPWFCTALPQATSDDLELRICHDQESSDENVLVSLVDIYMQ